MMGDIDDWLVVEPTPLKNDGLKVSWDDDIPNWMEKQKMFQTTNQMIFHKMFDWVDL